MKLNFSEIIIYKYLAIAFAIYLIFFVFKKIMLFLIKNNELKNNLTKYIPVFEFFIWILFFFFSFKDFLSENQYFAIFIFILGIFTAIWSSKLFLKDYFSGIIFKLDKSLKKGDIISVNNETGKILNFKLRYIEFETSNSDIIYIPYSQIISSTIKKKSVSKNFVEHIFQINVSKSEEIKTVFSKINEIVLSSPGISINEKPNINIVSQNDKQYIFEVKISVTEQYQGFLIEKTVKEKI